LTEYLYLPIAYSLTRKLNRKEYFGIRSDKIIYSIAISITFILCGLWHGANWTFIIWGSLFAFYLVFSLITKRIRKTTKKILFLDRVPILPILITFGLTTFSWIFFRADNVTQAMDYITHMFSVSFFSIPQQRGGILLIVILILIEWLQRKKQHALDIDRIKLPVMRWAIYYIVIIAIMNFGGSQLQFIYFQF